MAYLNIKNVAIKGLSACVPEKQVLTEDIYKWDGADSFIHSTGIRSHREADKSITASDLCTEAAEKLILELDWEKHEIECLVFVTQTPDYTLPATSCLLQHRLGLSKECYTIDISLGCSGWVYGLSVIATLMQGGTMKKGLLLAGDTISKICNTDDKSTFPLFGDAGSATALEYCADDTGMKFVFNTDGKGGDAIIVRDGGFRNPTSSESMEIEDRGDGIKRTRLDLELDGMDVFSFGITKAPKSVKQLCDHFNINIEDIDVYSFHQANLMMNEMIRKKLKLPEVKVPYCMNEFGNTSSASIPLVLVTRDREGLRNTTQKHIACGFGVGLSWGSVYFETDKIVVPDLIEI